VAVTVVPVELAERSYEITIGPGVLASSGSALKAADARRGSCFRSSGATTWHCY
jgi:hypothetical protein